MKLDNRDSILTELIRDVEVNKEKIKVEDNQLNRRNYLRSLFTLYEASLSNLREVASQLIVTNWEIKGQQNLHEIYPLLDQQALLSDSGKLKLGINKFSFVSQVAYCFKKYHQLIEMNAQILGDHKWNDFKSTVKVRNRITHPKFEQDVVITDEELVAIENGEKWWKETRKNLYLQHIEWMNKPKAVNLPTEFLTSNEEE